MSSSDDSLACSSSEDTDIDVAEYDLEVESLPNSSAQEALIKKQTKPTLGRHKLQFRLFATFS